VAVGATVDLRHVCGILRGIRVGRNVGHGSGKRLRDAADYGPHRENNFGLGEFVVDRRNGPEVNDDGSHVLIRQIAEVHIRHERKQGAAIVADALAKSPCEQGSQRS